MVSWKPDEIWLLQPGIMSEGLKLYLYLRILITDKANICEKLMLCSTVTVLLLQISIGRVYA